MLALPPIGALVVKGVIRIWLLQLANLDVPSWFLTCAITLPCLVLQVLIGLSLR